MSKLDEIIGDLDSVEKKLRNFLASGGVDFGIRDLDAWGGFSDVIFKGKRIDEVKARGLLKKIEADLRSRFASRGENYNQSTAQTKIKRLKGVLGQNKNTKGKRRKFSKYISQLTNALQSRDLEGVESIISNLENVRDDILDLEDSESASITPALEDIEGALHDLSASGSLEQILGYISSAKTNLKRHKANKPPSGVVVFEDEETEQFYRYARDKKEFKRSEVQDAFGWSESKFYEKLRDLRRKCQIDVKEGTGKGSKAAVYVYRGRAY